MEYYEFREMNSEIVLAAEGESDGVARGFERARAFVESSAARFTRFSETSELARLNREAGEWFPASPELFDVVRQAVEFAEETGGLFDPTILDAIEGAGYDRSMDELRANGATPPPRTAKRDRPDFRAIQLDEAARAIRLSAGTRLDLGGIAKGWIAERAAKMLAANATACAVSAGGDLFAVGMPEGEAGWSVGLEDPLEPSKMLGMLSVGPGGVATSSVVKRRWRQGDVVRHHLIDPRRGEPAETDWLSVTVFAPQAATAEVYAKALLIAGPLEAEEIGARRNDIAFIAVGRDGQIWGSAESKRFLNVQLERV